MATARGVVKKVKTSDFVNAKTRGIIAINLDEGDKLVSALLTKGNDEVVLDLPERTSASYQRGAGAGDGASFAWRQRYAARFPTTGSPVFSASMTYAQDARAL